MMLCRFVPQALRTLVNAILSFVLPPIMLWQYGRSLKEYELNHLLFLGDRYLFLGRWERALKLYLVAFEKDPDSRWRSGASLLRFISGRPLKTEIYFRLL